MKKDNKKSAKIRKNYCCKKCDYNTSDKKDFKKHLSTLKHNLSAKDNQKSEIVANRCKFCNKTYKWKSGLSRHKKKCKKNPKNIVAKNEKLPSVTLSETENPKNDDNKSLIELLMQQTKRTDQALDLLKKSIQTNSKMMPKIGNNNNNTISINVFLNEQCKNAMNLTDFMDKVKISLEDLAYSKNNGYVKGVTNIFAKQLKDLKPTERPIHCSDTKRLQFYVKDEDKWAKDENNEKINNTLTNIKVKQSIKIGDWEKLHPNYRDDPQLLDDWMSMMAGINEDTTADVLKQKLAVKRRIAAYIEIKEAMGIK